MSYVKADLASLEQTALRLGQVASTLAQARSGADSDGALVGQADLAGALGDFADNWRIRRERLTKAVEGAHTFVSGAVTAYRDLDTALAEACTPEGQGK
ncbi:hypothetical protein Kisp01_50710 [Kineosporia sp. NBRC 101677]|uniref:hypothetical protein n=1 Tax=Kineosporia sp. NBRC 101677 TaxID=3032197 RepID=UPI0024A02449|nr:hypothetical protein [Kineosporia sp. NBRC 101677]GLY18057.1 hypothetical protein Kisp01_50710 [Kineosporia sp. NBRC 101677]